MASSNNRSARPRLAQSVWGQVWAVLVQPEHFFKALAGSSSAWLLIALVLMLLTGISEVQRQERLAAGDSGTTDSAVVTDPSMSGDPSLGGGGDPGLGGVPLPPADPGAGGTSSTPITPRLEQVLGATGRILAMWLVLVPLLALIPLLNGHAPKISRLVQVAVWATVPLGVLALMQMAYYGAGGKAGQPGLIGLVSYLPFYATFTATQQSFLLSAASKTTLFHLWVLALLSLGGRQTLRGRRFVVALVVAAWVGLMVALPVVLGEFPVEQTLPPVETLPGGDLPPCEMPPLMPSDTVFEGSQMTPEPSSVGMADISHDTPSDAASIPDPAVTEAVSGQPGDMSAPSQDQPCIPSDPGVTDPAMNGSGGDMMPTAEPMSENPSGGRPMKG